MDEKKKKIIAIVAVIVVAIVAIVAAVIVDKNNKKEDDVKDDGVIVENIDEQKEGEYEEVEVELDENGNLVVKPNKDSKPNQGNKPNKDNNNKDNNHKDDANKPNSGNNGNTNNNTNNGGTNNGNANNGGNNGNNDTQNPSKPEKPLVKPDPITQFTVSYGKNSNNKIVKLLLSWNDVGASYYEVSMRPVGDLEWTILTPDKNKISLDIITILEAAGSNSSQFEFVIRGVNEVNGKKQFGDEFKKTEYIIVAEKDLYIPKRDVTLTVRLPKMINAGELTVTVNGKQKEVRKIAADDEVESTLNREEVFNLGKFENGVDIKVKLTGSKSPMVENKTTYVANAIINLRDNDIEILPEDKEETN